MIKFFNLGYFTHCDKIVNKETSRVFVRMFVGKNAEIIIFFEIKQLLGKLF